MCRNQYSRSVVFQLLQMKRPLQIQHLLMYSSVKPLTELFKVKNSIMIRSTLTNVQLSETANLTIQGKEQYYDKINIY